MKWRVSYLRLKRVGEDGVEEPKWVELGIVEADAENDVYPFAEKEWGMTRTDEFRMSPLIKIEHAGYLYRAIKEFLAEIEENEMYPETTAVEWMRHAISLVEGHDNMKGKEPRRV